MITARQALALPRAQVRPSDMEVVRAVMGELDVFVRENMTREGCAMPVEASRFNPQIVLEIERQCRALGWNCQFQQRLRASKINPKEQIVEGTQIAMQPLDAAYVEQHDIH